MRYAYFCRNCGLIEGSMPASYWQCRCGLPAKRRYAVSVNRSSLRSEARWDPVVGEYVENNRHFRSLLAKGQAEQSEKLNMDVKLETVDARDSEGLAELHGWKDREADLEGTKRAAR
jgi:hypothetical protein